MINVPAVTDSMKAKRASTARIATLPAVQKGFFSAWQLLMATQAEFF